MDIWGAVRELAWASYPLMLIGLVYTARARGEMGRSFRRWSDDGG